MTRRDVSTRARTSSSDVAPVLLSVVIPTKDRPDLALRAVRSVRESDSSIGVVLVDDGSRPHLRRELELVARADMIDMRSGPQTGPSAARNVGVRASRSQWVLFLDDDDVVLPQGLKAMEHLLAAAEGAGLVFGAVEFHAADSEESEVRLPETLGAGFDHVEVQFVAGGFCIARSVFDSIAGYDESLRYSENTDLVLRALEYCVSRGLGVLTVSDVLSSVTRRPADERTSTDPEQIAYAADHLLERFAPYRIGGQSGVAALNRVAGVNYARLRRKDLARDRMRSAARSSSSMKDWARYAVLCFPVVWQLVWKRP